jgi:hypothetical protein
MDKGGQRRRRIANSAQAFGSGIQFGRCVILSLFDPNLVLQYALDARIDVRSMSANEVFLIVRGAVSP